MNFLSLLTLAFIVLKLTDAISWSWVWVLSPMLLLMGFALLCATVAAWIEAREARERDEAFRKNGY